MPEQILHHSYPAGAAEPLKIGKAPYTNRWRNR